MRVGLIDSRSDGHHSEYARILCAALKKAGVDTCLCMPAEAIAVVCPGGIGAQALELAEVRTRGLRKQILVLRQYRKAVRHLRTWGATHLHFLCTDGHLPAIWEAARRGRLTEKWRLTVHWASGVGIVNGSAGIRDQLNRCALMSLLRSGARALVHHRELVDQLESRGGQGRVDVSPYPVLRMLAPNEFEINQYRRDLGIPREAILLLCFGETRRYKGADLAIRALACLDRNFYLLIAGKPGELTERELNELAEQLAVSDRVRIVGRFIPDGEVGICFHAADIVLLAYRSEFSGQSGPLTLAAAAGRLVVAPAGVVISATVREYRLGYLYPAENIEAMVTSICLAAAAHEKPRTEEFIRDHSFTNFGIGILRSYSAN